MILSRLYLPIKFINGPGSLSQLGKEVARIGKTALLVTYTETMRSLGVLDKVLKDLETNGVRTVIFDKVDPNPRTTTIDEGAKIARENNVQVVIGLGGGSVMDAAKSIALASSGTDPIWAHYEGKANSKGKVPAIVVVPTIAASGSESNSTAVFTNWDTHEKVLLVKTQLFPAVSIIDPALNLTLPAKITAQGGFDIFCHLVETYATADEPNLINDSLREACMRTVVESLPAVLDKLDDIVLRSKLSWASTIAGSQLNWLGGGGGLMTLHGLEHPLSGQYDLVHADGLAALLIEWMRFTLPVRQDRFKMLGERVFGEPDGIAATEKWLQKIGMRIRLRDLGVKESDFDKLVDNTMKTGYWVQLHPRPFDNQAIKALFQKSF
jgi:alcohol dehydrogenase YqhD (iron-dependent ADH family)